MANGYKKALADFEQAVRDHENMGAQHPGDHGSIQKRYEDTKALLIGKLQYRKLAAECRAAGYFEK